MEILAVLLIMVILAAVLYVVSAPLRKGHEALESRSAARRAELEAAKDAKYREIRDAEMDFQTGKLDAADHKLLDRQLRAEAMEILHALDAEGLMDGDDAVAEPVAEDAEVAPKPAPAKKAAAVAAAKPAPGPKEPVTAARVSKPATPSTNPLPRKNRRRGR